MEYGRQMPENGRAQLTSRDQKQANQDYSRKDYQVRAENMDRGAIKRPALQEEEMDEKRPVNSANRHADHPEPQNGNQEQFDQSTDPITLVEEGLSDLENKLERIQEDSDLPINHTDLSELVQSTEEKFKYIKLCQEIEKEKQNSKQAILNFVGLMGRVNTMKTNDKLKRSLPLVWKCAIGAMLSLATVLKRKIRQSVSLELTDKALDFINSNQKKKELEFSGPLAYLIVSLFSNRLLVRVQNDCFKRSVILLLQNPGKYESDAKDKASYEKMHESMLHYLWLLKEVEAHNEASLKENKLIDLEVLMIVSQFYITHLPELENTEICPDLILLNVVNAKGLFLQLLNSVFSTKKNPKWLVSPNRDENEPQNPETDDEGMLESISQMIAITFTPNCCSSEADFSLVQKLIQEADLSPEEMKNLALIRHKFNTHANNLTQIYQILGDREYYWGIISALLEKNTDDKSLNHMQLLAQIATNHKKEEIPEAIAAQIESQFPVVFERVVSDDMQKVNDSNIALALLLTLDTLCAHSARFINEYPGCLKRILNAIFAVQLPVKALLKNYYDKIHKHFVCRSLELVVKLSDFSLQPDKPKPDEAQPDEGQPEKKTEENSIKKIANRIGSISTQRNLIRMVPNAVTSFLVNKWLLEFKDEERLKFLNTKLFELYFTKLELIDPESEEPQSIDRVHLLYEISLKFLDLSLDLPVETFKAAEKRTLQKVVLKSIQSVHYTEIDMMPKETAGLFEELFSNNKIFDRPIKIVFQLLTGHIEYWNLTLLAFKNQQLDSKQIENFRFVLKNASSLFSAKDQDPKIQMHSKYDFLTLTKFCRLLYRANARKSQLKDLEPLIDKTTSFMFDILSKSDKVELSFRLDPVESKDKLELATLVYWIFSLKGTKETFLYLINRWLRIALMIKTPELHEIDARILDSCMFRLLQQAQVENITLKKSDTNFAQTKRILESIAEYIDKSDKKFIDLRTQYSVLPIRQKILKQLDKC